MPELRLNLITRERVIIAAERSKRPDEIRQGRDKKYLPDHDKNCPFCPINEDKKRRRNNEGVLWRKLEDKR